MYVYALLLFSIDDLIPLLYQIPSEFQVFNFWLINESALKFNESALKNLLLNLTNLPLKI